MFSSTSGAPRTPDASDAAGMRFAVVAARFNGVIADALLAGARRAFAAHGVDASRVTIVRVPGAFEIPLAAKTLAASGDYAAVIALGAVIRGETAHFDFVAGECARGLQRAALDTGVPMLFGVLTTDTAAQAEARSGEGPSNKGWECVEAAITMAAQLRDIRAGAGT